MGVVMLASSLAVQRTVTFERAAATVPDGFAIGLAALRTQLQTQISSGTAPTAPPPTTATCVSGDTPCSYSAVETITLTTQTTPAPAATCAPGAASECANNLQAHPLVNEGRVAAAISTAISDSSGTVLLTRVRYVSFRTFAVAPYVALIGERDGTLSDGGTVAEGEDAGNVADAQTDDTRIRVRYYQTTPPGSTPVPGPTPAPVSRDQWSSQTWSNSNGNATGWTR